MRAGPGRPLAWGACAALLLTSGFLTLVAGSALWIGAGVEADAAARMRAAFALYAWVVLAKGLLPSIAIAVCLWTLLDRLAGLSGRGARGIALGVIVAATLASAVAVTLVLPQPLPGLPPVRFHGPGNVAQSALEMSAAVAAALGLAYWGLGRGGRGRVVRADEVLGSDPPGS